MHSLDLNLLRVLDALLAERHVTRAAGRLGLSQPATSHALARLRAAFGDRLFVRTPQGLRPTARASELAGPLRAALATLEHAVEGGPGFDPRAARRTFQLLSNDYGSFVVVPALYEGVRRAAPGVDLWVRGVRDDPCEQLANGEADALVGPRPLVTARAGIHARRLFVERFVCMVREGHPRVRDALDLDTWVSLPHLLVAPRGSPGGVVDEVLGGLGLARRVALAVPHFLAAPPVVAGSDLVLTVGERVARAFAKTLPVRLFEPPVALPGFEVTLAWHARNHDDPAQQWLRAKVLEAAG
ncbi:MAG: LysR family transcriptional regulator [Deltaproteobacteria bacterium]|nr:LysR family transcriptional regulator [Deltaproteobacteria bacterium]